MAVVSLVWQSDYEFPDDDADWSPVDLAACWATVAGRVDWMSVTALAVALTEAPVYDADGSGRIVGWSPWARGPVGWITVAGERFRTMDVGGWQLTTGYHVDRAPFPGMEPVSVDACLDPFRATARALEVMRRTSKGSHDLDLSWWTTYKTGAHEQQMRPALDGMNGLRAGWLGLSPL